jgi:hypothetical protein
MCKKSPQNPLDAPSCATVRSNLPTSCLLRQCSCSVFISAHADPSSLPPCAALLGHLPASCLLRQYRAQSSSRPMPIHLRRRHMPLSLATRQPLVSSSSVCAQSLLSAPCRSISIVATCPCHWPPVSLLSLPTVFTLSLHHWRTPICRRHMLCRWLPTSLLSLPAVFRLNLNHRLTLICRHHMPPLLATRQPLVFSGSVCTQSSPPASVYQPRSTTRSWPLPNFYFCFQTQGSRIFQLEFEGRC